MTNSPAQYPKRLRALANSLPILHWLPRYDRNRLQGDLLAGAIVAALMIPQSLGYARIAGVPVEIGLYAVPLALVAYAFLGSSPQLIVGPASTVAIVSGSLVRDITRDNPEDAVAITAALAIASGLVLIATGLLRVGWIAEFLSRPIVTGFVFGLTLTIIIGELPTLLGIPKPGGDLLGVFVRTLDRIENTDLNTLIVGGSTLAAILGGRKLSSRVPWGLVALVGAVAASKILDLESTGVAMIGDVPGGLPPLGIPNVPRDDLAAVVVGGASLALVAMAEGLAATRLFATRGGYRVETEYELVGMGASNIGAGLSGGLGVAGSLSKTAAADQAGSTSQVTGLSAAAVVCVVLAAFTWFFTDLPQAALSAIVIAAVWGLMDVPAMRRFLHIRRADFVAAVVAIGGVVLFGPLPGLGIAIATSLLSIIYRSSAPRMEVLGKIGAEKAAWGRMRGHTTRTTVPGIVVVRLDTPLFWANATAIEDRLLKELQRWPDTHALVLDLEATSQLSSTAADMLDHLHRELATQGISLYLARVIHPVSSVLRRSGFIDVLGEDHIWHSISQCVRAARKAEKSRRREETPEARDARLLEIDFDPDSGDSSSESDDVEVVDSESDDTAKDAYFGGTRLDALRQSASDFYTCAFHEGRPLDAAATYLSPEFREHSTGVPSGIAGFVDHAKRLIDRYPELSIHEALTITDGSKVFLLLVMSDDEQRQQWVTTEFFEADDEDRLAEHWSVVAPRATEEWLWSIEPSAQPPEVEQDQTEVNKILVRTMIETDLIGGVDTDALAAYFAPNLVDNGTMLPSGHTALRSAINGQGGFVYDELVLLVGEKSLVATLCQATWAGTPVAHVDIFRLEHGRITEHWDSTEVVPPESERVNSGSF